MGMHPRYKTPEEMQKVIDEYFESCEGEILTDADGNAVLNKYGMPVRIGEKPPTVTGLALALGFTGRQLCGVWWACNPRQQALSSILIRCSNYNFICTLLHKGSLGNRAVFVCTDLR